MATYLLGHKNTLEALVALFLSHKGDEFTLKSFFFSTLLMGKFQMFIRQMEFCSKLVG